ncbi:P-loop containing nucleoside triphosphate hydrolase protein [Teratosphaeria nubilosa]|uniref:RNA helicase n=1 Tax=Teratosphaeria nubilosa TaxID=161662 RepID=A0A6G1L3S1_9PEZI|nr:P-loop containing nucleoside triphosphate hydrolase protein [Teratosphaeria nubilosa]
MLRLSTACPFCEARSLARSVQRWQSQRHASTLQKRKPSRMVLSPHVGRGAGKTAAGGKPARASRNSPFGGMNVTAPPRGLHGVQRHVSAAEQKRTSRASQTKAAQQKKEPMKALKMQRRLASVSYEKRSKVKHMLEARDSFDQFDLLGVIKESVASQALGGLVDVSPTPIQRLAIPAILGTEDDGKRRRRRQAVEGRGNSITEMQQQFLLAAETGSGKTLAYVLPVIDAIKRAEMAEAEQERIRAAHEAEETRLRKAVSQKLELEDPDMPHPTTARPKAIILLPTSELVAQVGALVKNLSHTVKLRAAVISSAFTSTVIKNRVFSTKGVDIVISTPHLLSSIAESDPNVLSRVTHVVTDEADSLLDRSFSPITSGIIDRATPSLQQLIFCSATIPRSLDAFLNKRFPETRRLVTPNLHAIPRRVQLSVVDIDKMPYQGNRDLACAQTIWDLGKEVEEHGEDRLKKVVVFVNEREKASELAGFLRAKGVDATALSRDSDERKQAEILAEFTGAAVSSAAQKQRNQEKKRVNNDATAITPADLPEMSSTQRGTQKRHLHGVKVLVTTDIASRGVDTVLVKHVILYDVPHTSIDFIHRLGRVGRMNRRGRGIVLVGKNDRKDIVREVRDGMFKGQALI